MRNYQGLLQKYLSKEISIDYKTCAYSFCLFLFYCGYLLLQGTYVASILYLVEIFVCTYIISYLQVYLFWNFDEAERIGIREAVGMLLSTILYTVASYFCGWFGKSLLVSAWFAVYLVFIFLSLFATNLIKRKIDTKELNQMLKGFQEGRG
ncbi:MAG TPA: DUF3021 domain-containing protein [Lachnospiraceae bacterium]|nr:DUF3021 domain-containing protein [Lachnospiraceae bacterium]